MTEVAPREQATIELGDPTGGRLVAWAQAAAAANQLAKALVRTSFVPREFQGKEHDATAAILMGDELGLSPIAALRSIYVVHGAPALYARAMVALAQSCGHEVWTEASSDQRVIVCGRRRGQTTHTERSEWTIDRARKAGYTSNKKYASNPQEMLYAKAASEVCRKIAADALAGVPFSVEDIELDEPAPTSTTQRATGEKRTTRRATVQAVPEPDLDEPDQPTPGPPLDEPEPVTEAQNAKLHALYRELEVTDRDQLLADASATVGRDLTSSAELTKDEASRLIDNLEERVSGMTPGEADKLFPDGAV